MNHKLTAHDRTMLVGERLRVPVEKMTPKYSLFSTVDTATSSDVCLSLSFVGQVPDRQACPTVEAYLVAAETAPEALEAVSALRVCAAL